MAKQVPQKEKTWVPFEVARHKYDTARQNTPTELPRNLRRRKFLGDFLSKTFAVGVALFGFSRIAHAGAECCDLLAGDGYCDGSCASACSQLPDSDLWCWTCFDEAIECCECMVIVNASTCWDAQSAECSCWYS